MQIDPIEHWSEIRDVFGAAFRSGLHYAIASVDNLGQPHVTPIGSVMLTTPGRGMFLQRFTTGLPKRIAQVDSIAILAVNSGRLFWARSLFAGRFAAPPAIRLNARVLGGPRPASADELARFQRRVRIFSRTRGHHLLWDSMGIARDFEVISADSIELGEMTRGHWMS